jgi:hypothetical protein
VSSSFRLSGQRFAHRFAGGAGTWVWLLVTLGPGVGSWFWANHALKGFAGDERTWFLWSGNIVLALFVMTLGFVFRKWAIKIASFRNRGRASPAMVDASWAEIQSLNVKLRKGEITDDAAALRQAEAILTRFGVEKVERPEMDTVTAGGKTVKFIRMRKREAMGRLEPWLEMHMGVGVAACVGVWFHADGIFRHPIGWILFIGSMIVLVTGVLGAILYRVLPGSLAKAGPEIPFEEAGVARENYEICVSGAAKTLPPELQDEIKAVFHASKSFDDLRQRCDGIMGRVAAKAPEQAEAVRDILVLAGTRDYLLWTTAVARRLDFHMKLWRWIHVPVSVFLFFAIALHVWVVLWY